MVAIQTKFIGPTNFRGARVIATTTHDRPRVTIHWDNALNSDDNHDKAAKAYCERMRWDMGVLASGDTDTGKVYVFLQRVFDVNMKPVDVAKLVKV